jgi:hypothetical protein
MQQGADDGGSFFHAAREGIDHAVGVLGEFNVVEQLVDALFAFGGAEVVQASVEFHVFADG